jgi:hypothetical protein
MDWVPGRTWGWLGPSGSLCNELVILHRCRFAYQQQHQRWYVLTPFPLMPWDVPGQVQWWVGPDKGVNPMSRAGS